MKVREALQLGKIEEVLNKMIEGPLLPKSSKIDPRNFKSTRTSVSCMDGNLKVSRKSGN